MTTHREEKCCESCMPVGFGRHKEECPCHSPKEEKCSCQCHVQSLYRVFKPDESCEHCAPKEEVQETVDYCEGPFSCATANGIKKMCRKHYPPNGDISSTPQTTPGEVQENPAQCVHVCDSELVEPVCWKCGTCIKPPQESREGDAFAVRFAKWFPRKDWLTEKRVRFFMENERSLALQEAADLVRGLERKYGLMPLGTSDDPWNKALEDAAREIESKI